MIKDRPYWSLLYFDGFAGTGEINTEDDDFEILEGAAKRILIMIILDHLICTILLN